MIKTVSEIFHSAKDSISKKSESPLIGAFLTAWIIWNWQPIMYFFFLNQDISQKIEKVLSYKSWLDQFLFPLIIAIFYILVLPYIQILFTLLLKKSESFQNKTILEKKKQISDEEHNQKLDLINKKIELENKEKYLREQSAINTQINDLNEQIKSKEKEIKNLMEIQSIERRNFEDRIEREKQDFFNKLSSLKTELQEERNEKEDLFQKLSSLKTKLQEVEKNNTINNTFTRVNNPFAEVAKDNMINNPFAKVTKNNTINNPFAEITKNNTINNPFAEVTKNNTVNNPFAKLTKNNTVNNLFAEVAKNNTVNNPFAKVTKSNTINNKIFGVRNSLNELQKNSTDYSDLLPKEMENENKKRNKP